MSKNSGFLTGFFGSLNYPKTLGFYQSILEGFLHPGVAYLCASASMSEFPRTTNKHSRCKSKPCANPCGNASGR